MDWHDEDILALLTTDLDSNYEVLVVKYIGQLCNYLEYKGASSPDAQDIVSLLLNPQAAHTYLIWNPLNETATPWSASV